MPNTKPVGVAYSDPELTSGTTIDSATITSATVTSPTVTGAIVTGAQFKSSRATAITAAATMAIADAGGIFTVAQSSAYDIDLPSPTVGAGLRYLFQLVSPGSFAVTITVAGGAATFEGTINNDVTSVIPCTGATITFASGVSALGDWVECISTATGKYFVRACTSAAGGITIA
jgi:hypothetical protein